MEATMTIEPTSLAELGVKLAVALQQKQPMAPGLKPPTQVVPGTPPPAGAVPQPGQAPTSPHAQAAAQAIQQPTAADIMTPQAVQNQYNNPNVAVRSEKAVADRLAPMGIGQKVAEERLNQTVTDVMRRTVFSAIRPILFQ